MKLYNLVILQGFTLKGAVKNLNSCAVSSKMDDVVARLNKIICLFNSMSLNTWRLFEYVSGRSAVWWRT